MGHVVEVVEGKCDNTHTHTQKDPKRSLDGEVCGNTSDFKIRKKTNPKSLKQKGRMAEGLFNLSKKLL